MRPKRREKARPACPIIIAHSLCIGEFIQYRRSLPQAAKGRFTEGISVSSLTEVGRVEPPAGATVASWLVTTLCCQRRPAASEHRKFAVHRSIQSVSDKRAFHARPREWYEL